VRLVEETREKPPKPKKPYERGFHDGWYEVTEMFPEGGERVRNVAEAEGSRVFVLGQIEGVVLVEVPDDMDTAKRNALGYALSERVKGNVMIVNERIRFMKLKRAAPAEEKRLHENAKEQATNPAPARANPAAHPSAGPVAPRDGGSDPRPDGNAAALGDDRDDAVADQGSGAAGSDP